MAGRIQGIEIAISADTTGVTRGLRDITRESTSVNRNLNQVNSLLRLNPGQTDLVAERQRLLSGALGTTREKLNQLRAAQEDVNAAFERGDISEEEYIAFQGEIARTESRLADLESQTDDTAEAEEEAEKKTGKFSDALKQGLADAAAVGAAALAAVGAATVKLLTSVIESAGELEQNLGGSKAVFQNYALIMQQTAEDAYKNMGLSQSEYLNTANKMGALFQGVGMTVKESADLTRTAMQRAADMSSVMGIDLSAAMESVAGAAKGNFTMMDNLGVAINDTTLKAYAEEKGLGELATTQDKVTAAMALFLEKTEQYDGNFAREATETITGSLGLLKASWSSLVAGLGTSGADVEKLVGNMTEALEAVVDNIAPVIENVAKAMPKVLKALIDGIAKVLPKLTAYVPEIVLTIVNGITENLPMLLQSAGEILMELVNGIIEQLPTLVQAAIDIITQLAFFLSEQLPALIPTIVQVVTTISEILIDNLDVLIDASIALILALADGLVAATPILIDKAPVIVEKLVNALIENAPKILGAALILIEKLVTGLIENFPKLIEAGKQILETLVNALKSGYDKAVQTGTELVTKVGDGIRSMASTAAQWGKDLIQGLINGIKSKIADVKNAVGDIAETIKSYLHFSVPDVGPLTTYESWMPDFMQGLANGINKNKHLVTEAMQGLTNDMSINPQATIQTPGAISNTQTVIINLSANISNNMDLRNVAEALGREIQIVSTNNAALRGA